MASPAIELSAFRLVADNRSAFDAYGHWDAVVALDGQGQLIDWHDAHDGDFFPETIQDYAGAIGSYLRGERAWMPPVRVDVDVTQSCNCDCTFCFSARYRAGGYRSARMSSHEIRKLIAGAATQGTRTVRFCGGGEPLAHPDICSFIPAVRDHGMQSCVITNGTLLDARTSEVCERVDHLRWSVNAVSEETRRLLHRPRAGGTFADAARWIAAIITRSQRRAPRSTMVWATFLLVPENVQEIVPAARSLQGLGVHSVSFRPVHHGLHSAWTPEALEAMAAALEEARSLATNEFLVFTPRWPPQAGDARPVSPHRQFRRCWSRLLRPVVEAGPGGPLVQSCGMCRGRSDLGWLLAEAPPEFGGAPVSFRRTPKPSTAPEECTSCIDISINRVLAFIVQILERQPATRFVRALRSSVVPPSRGVPS